MLTTWQKSIYSGGDKACVEIRHASDAVFIRDSKFADPADSPIITIPAAFWPEVLELGLNQESGTVAEVLTITVHDDGGATFSSGDARLVFTPPEMTAWGKAVADGQFDRT